MIAYIQVLWDKHETYPSFLGIKFLLYWYGCYKSMFCIVKSMYNLHDSHIYLWMNLSFLCRLSRSGDAGNLVIIGSCIDLLHKSHNAPIPYPIMHHFVTEMCMCAHFCYKMVHCGIFDVCIVGFMRWVYWHVICFTELERLHFICRNSQGNNVYNHICVWKFIHPVCYVWWGFVSFEVLQPKKYSSTIVQNRKGWSYQFKMFCSHLSNRFSKF